MIDARINGHEAPYHRRHLESLTCGLPPSLRDRDWMALFQAYVDDSGSHGDGPWYVLAGFLALSSQWSRFSDAWHQCLQKEPAIEYFKMSEAHSMKGQFASFNPRLRDQKVLDLAEIAERHSIARICAVVSREDFDNYIKGCTPWREMQNPYFMLFYQVMVLTIDFFQGLGHATSMNVEDFEVDFIFDEQGRVGLDALAWWDVFKQALKPEQLKFLGSAPIFRSDRKILPLQAADLHAWHARHAIEGGDSSIRTGAVIHVLKKIPPIGSMVTGDQMLKGLPELSKIAEDYWPK